MIRRYSNSWASRPVFRPGFLAGIILFFSISSSMRIEWAPILLSRWEAQSTGSPTWQSYSFDGLCAENLKRRLPNSRMNRPHKASIENGLSGAKHRLEIDMDSEREKRNEKMAAISFLVFLISAVCIVGYVAVLEFLKWLR